MAKSRERKVQEVEHLTAQLAVAKSIVFASTQALKVKESTELRGKLREQGVALTVAKRSLLTRALKGSAYQYVDLASFRGGLAVASSPDDEIVPAKMLAAFAKDHPTLTLLGGALDGRVLAAPEIQALAKLPSRDELRGQLVGVLASPLRGLVTTLAGSLRGLVTALRALHDQRSTIEDTLIHS